MPFKRIIIGIVGQKRVGKDTLGDFFVDQWGFQRLKFADPLKDMTRALLKSCGVEDPEPYVEGDQKEYPLHELKGVSTRKIMQLIGHEWVQMVDPHLWAHIWKSKVEALVNRDVVTTDVRYLHEVKVIREVGGHIIRIVRPGFENQDNHPSESEQKLIEPDFEIVNEYTTGYLCARGESFLRDLTCK